MQFYFDLIYARNNTATIAVITPYMNIGTKVFLMIAPSWLCTSSTEHTATILLIQTILPIAPPTDCKAKTKVADKPVSNAICI